MIVVGILNSKGGVGKSTLTAALAVRAARDNRVCIVDLDPQGSLSGWYDRRGGPDNPRLLHGEDRASDAIETLRSTGYDVVFLDGPPGSLLVTEDAVKCSDLVIIPMRASGLDLLASQDCIRLCQRHGKPYAVVLNDVASRDPKALADNARKALAASKVPVAKTVIAHRVQHINAMTSGATGAEKDRAAAEDVDALWQEARRIAPAARRRTTP